MDLRPDWYAGEAKGDDDAVIVLRGRERYEPASNQTNLLWLVSHPDEVSDSELETFDHVFVASESYADRLASKLSVPISSLLQCSDPAIFHPPAASKDTDAEILFVGNSRGEMRQVVADAIAQNLPVSIFGQGWGKFLSPERISGRHIRNEKLHKHYGRAKIVLSDQWPDMEREGFIPNRIFDVALSGGFIISKDFKGSELLGDDLVTYRTPEELGELCRKWLSSDVERLAAAERLRRHVLASHTFSHRAREFVAKIMEIRKARGA